jgi:hypothetical protein
MHCIAGAGLPNQMIGLRFCETQKEDDRGPLSNSIQSSLLQGINFMETVLNSGRSVTMKAQQHRHTANVIGIVE